MPEEHPLQALVSLELILKAKLVVLVSEFKQIQHLGRCFVGRERWGLVVVNDDGDAAVGIKAQEPLHTTVSTLIP